MVLVAESATQKIKTETGDRFLILNNGYRYDGRPGKLDFRSMQFSSYGVRVSNGEDTGPTTTAIRSTRDLWGSSQPKDMAELQWRLSLPLLVPIVALIAIALSKVKPRQGRFAKLVPAFCVYLIYMLLLIAMRTAIKSQTVPAVIGVWWVHSAFLLLALVLFRQEQLTQWLKSIKKSPIVSGPP
jgi:lipopolysaccharide export system permease protein